MHTVGHGDREVQRLVVGHGDRGVQRLSDLKVLPVALHHLQCRRQSHQGNNRRRSPTLQDWKHCLQL